MPETMRASLLTVWGVPALLLLAIPGPALDHLGTCALSPTGWAHEPGVRFSYGSGFETGTPYVWEEGGAYRMLFASGISDWSIVGSATSPDGINWTFGSTWVTSAALGVTNILEPFLIQGTDGNAYLYVEGWNVFEDASSGSRGIYRFRSADNVTWTPLGVAWPPSLREDFPASPMIDHLPPGDPRGSFAMYYTAMDDPIMGTGLRHLYLATSQDGVDWTRRGRVMTAEEDGTTDGPVRIALARERGAYRLYYSEHQVEGAIRTAVSTDGLNWTKEGELLGPGPTGENNRYVTSPTVLQPSVGRGRMYYMGSGTTTARFQIFSASTVTRNADPIVDAGPPQEVPLGATATVNGSATFDLDLADQLTYAWRFVGQPANSTATLTDPDPPVANFVADQPGTYTLQLTVADDCGGQGSALTAVTAVNAPPTATVGATPSLTVPGGTAVTLDSANSRDPEGMTLASEWSLLRTPENSGASIVDPFAGTVSVTLDALGDYEVSLQVTDPYGASDVALVRILAFNRDPVPSVTVASPVPAGTPAVFDATASSDPDGHALNYSWRISAGPPNSTAGLSATTGSVVSLIPDRSGAFVVELTLTDPWGGAVTQPSVLLATNDAPVPVLAATPSTTISVGATVRVAATASLDAEGHPFTFHWSLLSAPSGSAAPITDLLGGMVELTPDVLGTYVVAVRLEDAYGAVSMGILPITGVVAPPLADAGPDQEVLVGTLVTLNGSESSAPVGGPLNYAWSFLLQPSESSAVLEPSRRLTSFVPDFVGTYMLQLQVFDVLTAQNASDTVLITATNSPPTVTTCCDRTVLLGGSAFVGALVSDPDPGQALSVRWEFVSRPDGSTSTFADPTAANTSFRVDVAGVYVVRLTVTDSWGSRSEDSVFVTGDPGEVPGPLLVLALLSSGAGLAGYGTYRRRRLRIEDLFLLGKDGILMKHYTRRQRPGADTDLLSAMLVAVQNFVDDAFSRSSTEAKPLEQFKFGDQTILIAKGEHLFIAALASGPDPQRLLPRIAQTLRTLEGEMGGVFQASDGDGSSLAGADRHMEGLLGIKRAR